MKITNKPNKNLFNAIRELNKKKLNVGWFESSKYEDGTPVAEVAVSNEFGSVKKNKPPRPFMRTAISNNNTKWTKVSEKISKDIFRGSNVRTSLNLLGTVVQSDIQESITSLTAPALAKSTINARKSKIASGRRIESTIEKPLIDSGYMLATLTSEVK